MRFWNYIPYREQKRLAHIRSWYMNVSGARQRRLKLVRANRELRKEKKALEDSIPGMVRQGVEAYVGESRKIRKESLVAMKEFVAYSLLKRVPEMPEDVKAGWIPNSVVLPIVLETLEKVDRRFRKSPLAIYSRREEINGEVSYEHIHIGSLFSRISKLGTEEINELIKEHGDKLAKLRNGKTYTIRPKEESFELVFHNFLTRDGGGMENIGVYAVPIAKEKVKVGKLMRNLGSSAIDKLQKMYEKLMTPEEDYGYGGLAHGNI